MDMPQGAPEISIDELHARLNGPAAASGWLTVTQAMIDTFAEATLDHQYIHVDPMRAAETPFGGTIAHGFLTLSLLSHLGTQAMPRIRGRTMGINYGFDRVRFVAPVKSGDAIRGHFTLVELNLRNVGEWQLKYQVVIEIRDHDKPALYADWLTLAVVPG